MDGDKRKKSGINYKDMNRNGIRPRRDSRNANANAGQAAPAVEIEVDGDIIQIATDNQQHNDQ